MGAVENIIYKFKFKADTDDLDESEQKTESLAKSVFKLGAGLYAAAGVKDIMGKAIGRIDTIDTATKSLALLQGSEEEAKKTMDGLVEAISGTPIALDEVALGAKKMVAAGMEGDKVTEVFTAMADAAYGVGDGAESLGDFTDIFAKIQSQGKLTTETMDSLQIRGVQSYKILANESGKSMDEIKEAISSGSISAEEGIEMLVKGIEKGSDGVAGATVGMEGLAKTAGDTISGSFKNASLSIVKSFVVILEPMKEPFIEFMKWFSTFMGNFNKKLEEWIGSIDLSGFANSFGGFEELGPMILDPLIEAFGHFKDMLEPFIPVVEKVVEVIGELLGEAILYIVPIISDMIEFWNELMEILQPLIDAIAEALIPIIDILKEDISNLMFVINAVITVLWAILKPIITGLAEIMVAILVPAVQAVQKIFEFLNPIVKILIDKFQEIVRTMIDRLHPAFLLIELAVKVVVAIFKIIIAIVVAYNKKLMDMWNLIKDKVLGIFDEMGKAIDNATGPFKTLIDWVKDLMEWFGKMWDSFDEILGNMIDAVDNFNPMNWFKSGNMGVNVFGEPNLTNVGSDGTTINQTFNIEAKNVMSKRDVYIASKTAARRV